MSGAIEARCHRLRRRQRAAERRRWRVGAQLFALHRPECGRRLRCRLRQFGRGFLQQIERAAAVGASFSTPTNPARPGTMSFARYLPQQAPSPAAAGFPAARVLARRTAPAPAPPPALQRRVACRGLTAASTDCSVCRSTSSAAFRSGTARRSDGTAPAASEASRNRPDFSNADLMSPPLRSGSRPVCCASTCCTACSSFGGSAGESAMPARLANSGAWLPCSVAAVCAAIVTVAFSSGVSTAFGGALVAGAVGRIDQRIRRQRHGVGGSTGRVR